MDMEIIVMEQPLLHKQKKKPIKTCYYIKNNNKNINLNIIFLLIT